MKLEILDLRKEKWDISVRKVRLLQIGPYALYIVLDYQQGRSV